MKKQNIRKSNENRRTDHYSKLNCAKIHKKLQACLRVLQFVEGRAILKIEGLNDGKFLTNRNCEMFQFAKKFLHKI